MSALFAELPAVLGDYTLTELIGRREHSELFAARQSYVERRVVIEVLTDAGPGEQAEADFLETARARAAAQLPHAVPVLDTGQSGGIRYIIQEYPPGVPLSVILLERQMTRESAFLLAEAEAEYFAACHADRSAALPLRPDDVYIDGDQVYFLTTVCAGSPTAEAEQAQLLALAEIIEQGLPPDVSARSCLPTVIDWIRHGYAGAPVRWASLSVALQKLRDKLSTHRPAGTVNRAVGSGRRFMLRRALHGLRDVLPMLCICSGIVAVGAACGIVRGYLLNRASRNPAVRADFVFCTEGGKTYRVRRRPVTVGEYEAFMQAWGKLPEERRAALCARVGVPYGLFPLRRPARWKKQLRYATGGASSPEESPVYGVSAWDAQLYACFIGEELPSAAQVRFARRITGDKAAVDELTADFSPVQLPYERCRIIYPAGGDTVLYAREDYSQEPLCGFRTCKEIDNPDNL